MGDKRFVVVDDFYEDPHAVRALARKAAYSPNGDPRQNFSGEETTQGYYSAGVIQKLARAVGVEIIVDPEHNAFGHFRVALGAAARPTRVHYDDTDYTAVVYLSLEGDCRGGTQFFRHRETGLDGPPGDQQLSRWGLTRETFDRTIVLRDTLDESKWDLIEQCDMRFNRCVILKGSRYFHGVGQLFGESFERARLTQNFFFNVR